MARETYKSNYGGERSAFGIAAIGNVANDTINLLRLWTSKDYSDNLRNSSDNYNYYKQLKNKEKIVKMIAACAIVYFILKK